MFKVYQGRLWKGIKVKGIKVWRCERCGEPLGDFGEAGGLKIRGEDINFRGGKVKFVCFKCGFENVIDLKVKVPSVPPPKKGKAFIPKGIKEALVPLTKTQLRKRHYKGEKDIKGLKMVGEKKPVNLGLVDVWQAGDVEYFIKHIDLAKLKETPKAYVSQDKNIKLLLAFVEKQQFNKEVKKAEASFTFKEYALARGYTEQEFKSGGKFFAELKQDLLAGAYMTYRVEEVIIDGKRYTTHGIPNFYTLYEPKDSKGWRVMFNSFYAEGILQVLNKEARQFYIHYLKEIADRTTTQKPYLHLFYNQIAYRRQVGKTSIPKKVINLLSEIGIAQKYLERPGECFRILKESLDYLILNYPEELAGVKFWNIDKTKSLPLKGFGEYKDFKLLLKAIGIEDAREAFVSFKKQPEALGVPALEPEAGEGLEARILKWVDKRVDWEKMTTLTKEGTRKYLKSCRALLGESLLYELFTKEINATYPDAVKFLTKTLKRELENKKNFKEKLGRVFGRG